MKTEVKKKRIVVKIGSNILTKQFAGIDENSLKKIVTSISELYKAGHSLIIVSSGAIACGLEVLMYKSRPSDMSTLQAAASIGQGRLIESYSKMFANFGITVGQVLLTQADFVSRQSYLYAKRTLEKLIQMRVIPIINENDAIAVEEIKFGDNDTLAALVSAMLKADYLFLLSDVEGFYFDKTDPKTIIHVIEDITPEIEERARGTSSKYGSGGMQSKVKAARIATCSGTEVFILDGKDPSLIIEALKGKPIGTRFTAKKKICGKKHWIAFALLPKGRIYVDEGARKALVERKKSLLPAGIKRVEGTFDVGDAVLIVDEKGLEVAQGLTEYASEEIVKVAGKSTTDIAAAGLSGMPDEVVHRDKLVILEGVSQRRMKKHGTC